MKNRILGLLRDSTEYVSGQELCEQFNVSRTAVWKAIEQLKKEGYTIEAVRNRGYRLITEGTDVYNKAEIDEAIGTTYIGRNCFFYNIIDSTNTEVKRLAEEGASDGTLVVADRQTAGKGRRGRTWISPEASNIYYSLLLRPEFGPTQAPMLTLIMALAVVEGIEELTEAGDDRVKIKWPNDIVVNGKKVCGILTEMSAERDYIQYVVIGTGINVKKQLFEEEIKQHASCLETELDVRISRSRLIGKILGAFEKYYEVFKRTGDLVELKQEYESHLINKDREVCVLDPKGEYTGVALGINETGELLVKKSNGEIQEVYAGEVSVRGIYGYV